MSQVSRGQNPGTLSPDCDLCEQESQIAQSLAHKRSHSQQQQQQQQQQRQQRQQEQFSCHRCEYSGPISHQRVHMGSHYKNSKNSKNSKDFKEKSKYFEPEREPEFNRPSPSSSVSSSSSSYSTDHPRSRTPHREKRKQYAAFQCPIQTCGRKFSEKEDWIRHMRVHNDHPEWHLKCHLCSYKTKVNKSLKFHLMVVHSNDPNFVCVIGDCDFRSETRAELERHIKTHRRSTLRCTHPNCSYSTDTENKFKAHVNKHKIENSKFKCKFCDYYCSHEGSLKRHMLSHNDNDNDSNHGNNNDNDSDSDSESSSDTDTDTDTDIEEPKEAKCTCTHDGCPVQAKLKRYGR